MVPVPATHKPLPLPPHQIWSVKPTERIFYWPKEMKTAGCQI